MKKCVFPSQKKKVKKCVL